MDALDQLSDRDGARGLEWLPAELPPHAKVVVSTSVPHRAVEPAAGGVTSRDPLDVLRAKLPSASLAPLVRMAQSEGSELLELWLRKAGRTLQQHQRLHVIERFEPEGMPLYLKLAFEEARQWRSEASAEETVLSIGIGGVIRGNLFKRLAAEEQHGGVLVARSLGYLAAAKNGLSEDELLDVLSDDREVLAEFGRRSPRSPQFDRLPVVVWSRLYFDLEPYLSEHAADGAALMSFYHRQLREVVEEVYLAGAEGPERHRHLARYFADEETQPLERQAVGQLTANLRRLSELPYQQTCGELWKDIYQTLTDFHFLEVKAAHAGMIETKDSEGRIERRYIGAYLLQDDYALALARIPGNTDGGTGGRRRIIVTGTDLGDGLKLRCPHCNHASDFNELWKGTDIECPRCGGPLRVNDFVLDTFR